MSNDLVVKEIRINDVDYVRKDLACKELAKVDGMEYVIVRCRNAGVHAGYLKERNEHTLTLINSRRLWRWWSKFTLSGLAMCGVLGSKVSEVRFACVLPEIQLTCSDVCEVIKCTDMARVSIESIKEHAND